MITIAPNGPQHEGAAATRHGTSDTAGEGSLFAALMALLTGQGVAPAPSQGMEPFTATSLPAADGPKSPQAALADGLPTGAWALPPGAVSGKAMTGMDGMPREAPAPVVTGDAAPAPGMAARGMGTDGVPEGGAVPPDAALAGAPPATPGGGGEADPAAAMATAEIATTGAEAEILADWRKAGAASAATKIVPPPGEPEVAAVPTQAAAGKPGAQAAAATEPNAAAAEAAAKPAATATAKETPPEMAEHSSASEGAEDGPRADPLQLPRGPGNVGDPRPTHLATRGPDRPADLAQGLVRVERVVRHDADRLTVVLSPPELGRVEVALHVRHGHEMRALITVDRADTLDLLQRDLGSLERSLGNAGVSVGSGSLQFELRQDQGRPQLAAPPIAASPGAAADDQPAEPASQRRVSSTRLVDLFA